MHHLSKLVFILFLGASSESILRAEKLRSIVVDENKRPLELVSVRQLTADSVFIDGTVTDSCGRFVMDRIPYARFVHLSALGFEDARFSISELPDTTCLMTSTHALGEVTVRGQSNTVSLNGSSIVVNVQLSPLGDMPTTEDVLNRLPSVSGSNGKYMVFGRGEAAIYINNRKITDSGELARLRPADIRKIEVVRNPGAEYDSSTPAVIRIYLKRSAFDGWGIEAMTYGSQGRRFTDYEQISVSYGTNPVNLFFTFSNSSSRLRCDQTNLQDSYTSDGVWRMLSDMPRWDSEYYNLAVNGGVNITLNKAHQFGAKITYTGDTQRNGGARTSLMTLDGNTYESLISSSSSPQGYDQYSSNIYYEGDFSDRTQLIFNGDYIHRQSHSENEITEQGNLTVPHYVDNRNESVYNLWSANIKLNWTPSDRLKLTFGGDGDIVNQRRISLQSGNTHDSSLDSKESRYALFCQGSYNLTSRYSISLGIRYESNHMHYTDAIESLTLLDKTYRHIYPTASVAASFGKTDMILTFTSKVRRPTFYQLRNSSEYFNRYETTEGNPFLLPTNTYDLSYSVGYKSLTANIGYKWITDYITEENIIDAEDPLHITSRPVNKPYYTALDMGVNYNHAFGCYHPYVSAELSKTFYSVDDRLTATPTIGKTPSMRFTISNYVKIGTYILYFDIKYSPAGNYCQYWEDHLINMDCGIYTRFIDKSLYVSLQASNLLGEKLRSRTFYANSVFERQSFRDTRRISLVISYTFRHSNKYRGKTSAQDQINRLD